MTSDSSIRGTPAGYPRPYVGPPGGEGRRREDDTTCRPIHTPAPKAAAPRATTAAAWEGPAAATASAMRLALRTRSAGPTGRDETSPKHPQGTARPRARWTAMAPEKATRRAAAASEVQGRARPVTSEAPITSSEKGTAGRRARGTPNAAAASGHARATTLAAPEHSSTAPRTVRLTTRMARPAAQASKRP